MNQMFLDVLQYGGAGIATIAALIVALDINRRWTGFGFVLFVVSSINLIAWGFMQSNSEGIGVQNIALLLINFTGVYRYLLVRPSDPRKANA